MSRTLLDGTIVGPIVIAYGAQRQAPYTAKITASCPPQRLPHSLNVELSAKVTG